LILETGDESRMVGPGMDGSRDGLHQKRDILHERLEDFTNSFARKDHMLDDFALIFFLKLAPGLTL